MRVDTKRLQTDWQAMSKDSNANVLHPQSIMKTMMVGCFLEREKQVFQTIIHKQLNLKKMENQTIKQTVESNEALSPQAETTKKQWIKPEMTVMHILSSKPDLGADFNGFAS